MKNKDKYKTPQERTKAFREFCRNRQCKGCDGCPIYDDMYLSGDECPYRWLELDENESFRLNSKGMVVDLIRDSHALYCQVNLESVFRLLSKREAIQAIWEQQDKENNKGV